MRHLEARGREGRVTRRKEDGARGELLLRGDSGVGVDSSRGETGLEIADAGGGVLDGLDEEGHGKVGHAVRPGEFEDDVGLDEVVADVSGGGEAVLAALLDKEAEEVLDEGRVLGLSGRVDGVLPETVLLGEGDGLVPVLVLLVEVGRDAAELEEVVLKETLGEVDRVKVVVGVDGVAEGGKVFLLDVEVVEGVVDDLVIIALGSEEVVLDEGEDTSGRGDVDDLLVVDVLDEHREEVVELAGVLVDVELHGLVVDVHVVDLLDDLLEEEVLPGLDRVVDHGEGGVVVVLEVDVEVGELEPLVVLLADADDLGDGHAGVEETDVLHELLGLVLGVEDGELSEHADVGALHVETSLDEGDELLKVAALLIVVDDLVELLGVDDDVETTDLSRAELLGIDAGSADLLPGAEVVGLAGGLDSAAKVVELDERGGKTGKVADVVEERLGGLVESLSKAAVTDLLDLGVVGR
mmetsp:Transcript_31357/g.52888  ORF Transcript_31357/g.52888 Transcript_31357/m.52888 type:complete len:467 (-) Transcript_31357:1669-3069(-)